MPQKLHIHFDNVRGFHRPVIMVMHPEKKKVKTYHSKTQNEFGYCYEVPVRKGETLVFHFGEANGKNVEDNKLIRYIPAKHFTDITEVWCRSWNPFVYTSQPRKLDETSAASIIEQQDFKYGVYISQTGGRFALGASVTWNGTFFGLFHPHAARVYVMGEFNDWQFPGAKNANPDKFYELSLHKGYFDAPNMWYTHVDNASVGQAYKFYIEYDIITGEHQRDAEAMVDPYARFLGEDYAENNSIVIDPTAYNWHDENYNTPAIHDLIVYELHVNGFTHNHPDIDESIQGTYQGVIQRINDGYFDKLGVTCLYMMPISEVPTPQGEDALGYNSSLFMSVERDFGTPDDLRQLVDTAHQHNLAVILDEVFNHSANSWNPLWKYILDHPDEMMSDDGGIYFSGSSPWGNRLATERTEMQNMLIDTCKLLITEYHIDGFRFDATHSMYIDHGFMQRLADELQTFKPDVILIAENLPNETDLNREGYNGYGQWCDFFHDTIKAMLREGQFEGTDNAPERVTDIFYFSKNKFAAHTNNVLNYCESHDEHSVSHEVGFVDSLNTPQAKERKARLGLFATMVALGQPMIYMGQELGTDRERNKVYFDFPENLDENGFYQWASRLISLRKRYPGLKLNGYNPAEEGEFQWLIAPWMDEHHGQGKRVVGWRATPTENKFDTLVILLNLENHDVEVDVDFGLSGKWVQLATIDTVNDIAPNGNNSIDNERTLHLDDTKVKHFTLQDSSGLIYKWEAE